MRKLTLLLWMISASCFAQYSTGVQTFTSGYSAKLDVNATLATLTINAPADRWFGLAFSNNTISAMTSSTVGDLVAFDGTNLTDRSLGGVGVYDLDPVQNWNVTSNTVSGSTRTLIATRVLNTGEAQDIVFTNTPSSVYIAWVRASSATFTLQPHGGLANAGRATQPISLSLLGVEDFSLNASSVYPNPSNGDITVTTKTALNEINVYSHVGAFVQNIKVNEANTAAVSIKGLSTGVYLLELKNSTDKSWKKIIVE
jgi:Secretion system C-terminal sorting domain